ncbi:MAG: AI-2E family transporter [Myxococcales bacterium]|nr:AI-2E family transporter [Myxococcales bacterium]
MNTFWQSSRRFAGLWGFALFLVLVVVLFRRVVVPFLLGITLCYVLAPAVSRIARIRIGTRTVPRFAAVLVVYLAMLSVLGLFFGAFIPRLSGDLTRLVRGAPSFFARVKSDYVPRASSWIEANFPADSAEHVDGPRPERKLTVSQTAPGRWDVSLEGLDVEVDPVANGRYLIGPRRDGDPDRLADLIGNLARGAESEATDLLKLGQRFVAGLIKGVATFVLILMIGAFLLVDTDGVHRFLRGLVPLGQQGHYDVVVAEMDRGLSGVIRGQLAICLVNGALTYLGLLIFHVKFPLLLGLLAAGMSLIPVFGSILSSIPIVAVALVGGEAGVDLQRGLATLGWIIGIHLLEANFLNPKIIGGAAKIHPVVVVFALLVGEDTGGLVGALLAVPVASMVQTLFLFFRRRVRERSEAATASRGSST